ncbi:hypothetical protein D3C86_1872200 [compost metagenome]
MVREVAVSMTGAETRCGFPPTADVHTTVPADRYPASMPRSLASSKILERRFRDARAATTYCWWSRMSVDSRVRRPAMSWARPEGCACVRSMEPSGVFVKRSIVSAPVTGLSADSHFLSSSEPSGST